MTTEATRLNDSETVPQASRQRMVLFLVCACQFMVILDSSIVNVALPSVQRTLGFTDTGLAWVVNGYLLTFAGLMLIGGRAGDVFGHRRVLITGLALFSGSSLVAGLATMPEVLVAARVVQGVGAALLAPSTLAIINTYFTAPGARAKAFGAWSASGGVGGLAGAIVGGSITTGLSWRWVFLINLPIGVVLTSIALMALVPTVARERSPLDLLGALTGTAGLASVIYGVMHTAGASWTSSTVLVPMVLGVGLLGGFLVVESRFAKAPMLPLRVFRVRTVAVGSGMLLVFGGVAIAMWYFTSLFMQDVLGYSAFEAGLGQSPAAVLFVVVARYAAGWLPTVGAQRLLLSGSLFFIAGFGWLSRADGTSSYLLHLFGPTVLISIGIGLTFPTLMAVATSGAPRGLEGVVGGVANTAIQAGGSVGLAVLATAASMRSVGVGSSQMTADGYSAVFVIAVALAVAIALISLMLPTASADGDSA